MTAGSLTWKSVRRYRLVRGILPAAVLAGLVVVWMFLDPIRNWLTMGALLKNDAPLVEVLKEAIVNSPDPSEAILAAWGTGKIVHREVAIRLASSVFTRPLSSELEDILLTGALDPDMNVREAGLAGLSTLRHPDLAALAVAQLSDPDPQVRLLGLKYLKDTKHELYQKYEDQVIEFFANYNPLAQSVENKKKLASLLLNPDIYDIFAMLRNKFYPKDKLPNIFSEFANIEIMLDDLIKQNVITVIKDQQGRNWLFLLTDIAPIIFFPEYLLTNIKEAYHNKDAEKKIPFEVAKMALSLLEVAYPEKVEF
ncbi:MAG: hypothetical protein ACFFKA_02480 [Candidatus Thorarchaeota archaeon]